MRLLIVSTEQRCTSYFEFREALLSLGVEEVCVVDASSCFLSKFRPLHIIPFPRLLKQIKDFNPDFVLTDLLYYVTHMAKLVSRPVFFHMRGDPWSESYWDNAMHPSTFVRIYKNYLTKIFLPMIRKADLIFANSKWLEEKIQRHLPNHPTRTLYTGISPEKWVMNNNTKCNFEHPAALSVFPFNIYAKVLGLLKFMRVIEKMSDINFYFVGDGPYFQIVKQKTPSNMFLVGKASVSEVRKMLDSCDIFVHPSGSDVLPRTVKEASLMEKPIVASNIGGIPEIVKDNETGYLCDIDKTDEWIEKIRFLLDNPNIARRLGKNACEYVKETFNWKKIAKDFLENLKSSIRSLNSK